MRESVLGIRERELAQNFFPMYLTDLDRQIVRRQECTVVSVSVSPSFATLWNCTVERLWPTARVKIGVQPSPLRYRWQSPAEQRILCYREKRINPQSPGAALRQENRFQGWMVYAF